jgi:uncharacterized protein YjiS (DUF1127 family)
MPTGFEKPWRPNAGALSAAATREAPLERIMADESYLTHSKAGLGVLARITVSFCGLRSAVQFLPVRLRGFVSQIRRLQRHVLTRFNERPRRAQYVNANAYALLELDDHLLRDIGLRRCEVRAAACGMLSKDFLLDDRHEETARS